MVITTSDLANCRKCIQMDSPGQPPYSICLDSKESYRFSLDTCADVVRSLLSGRFSAIWFTWGRTAALHRGTNHHRLYFYVAGAIWPQNLCSWLNIVLPSPDCSAFSWKGGVSNCIFLSNCALPRSSAHLLDFPGGFKTSLTRSRTWETWQCWSLSGPVFCNKDPPFCCLLASHVLASSAPASLISFPASACFTLVTVSPGNLYKM